MRPPLGSASQIAFACALCQAATSLIQFSLQDEDLADPILLLFIVGAAVGGWLAGWMLASQFGGDGFVGVVWSIGAMLVATIIGAAIGGAFVAILGGLLEAGVAIVMTADYWAALLFMIVMLPLSLVGNAAMQPLLALLLLTAGAVMHLVGRRTRNL